LREISLWRGFAPVNACPARVGTEFHITSARFGRWAPPDRQRDYAQNAGFAAQWQCEDAACPDFLAWLDHALAVDADVAGFDESLGKRAAFRQPDAVEEAVDPQRFGSFQRRLSFANSAKA